MSRIRQESRVLRDKSIDSLRGAIDAFNSLSETSRTTRVLLLTQHSFEMLLKAALVQRGRRVFDVKSGRAFSLEMCIGLAQVDAVIRLSAEDAGMIRVIDRLRNVEQHWIGAVDEEILYLHVRAAVTLFDEVLVAIFGQTLADVLPRRALPIASVPPSDIQLLIDSQFTQIAELLRPGKRARASARARIRTLLALEGHLESAVAMSMKDVDRVEEAIKAGASRSDSFPRLEAISARSDGHGLNVNIHFTRKSGAPVHFDSSDSASAGIREVDLQRRFSYSSKELATEIGLTPPKAWALRKHLAIEDDTRAHHLFTYGKMKHAGYSERAVTLMRDAMAVVDMDQVWRGHRPGSKTSVCVASECAGMKK